MGAAFPYVSVAVPTFNEQRTIAACLEALTEQDVPTDHYEILVIDGRSDDRTRAIVDEIASVERVPIRLLDNPLRTVPAALNRALAECQGEYLVRVDGHSKPTHDYVRRCVEANVAHDADLAGGWVRAEGRTPFGKAAAVAFGSALAMGNPGAWNPPRDAREVASVPCGSYRVSALRAVGGFDEAQAANQDYEVNYRLRRAGGRIVLIPDVSFTYLTRDTPSRLARQFFRYGFYKARVMVKHPRSIRIRHLVPAGGLVLTVALAVVAIFSDFARWLLLAFASLYVVLLLGGALLVGRRERGVAWRLPLVFFTMHASWAFGNAIGLVRWLASAASVRERDATAARNRRRATPPAT